MEQPRDTILGDWLSLLCIGFLQPLVNKPAITVSIGEINAVAEQSEHADLVFGTAICGI